MGEIPQIHIRLSTALVPHPALKSQFNT